jgi:transcription termination factor Rho
MHLSELKALHVSALITMGEELEIENVARMRKQELMFAIMKKQAHREQMVFYQALNVSVFVDNL